MQLCCRGACIISAEILLGYCCNTQSSRHLSCYPATSCSSAEVVCISNPLAVYRFDHATHGLPCVYRLLSFPLIFFALQGKPALWNAILEPEDNADDVEHFQDIPDSPTHDSLAHPAASQAEAEAEAEAEAGAVGTDEDDDEEDQEGDMGPSTSGQKELPGALGQLQGSGPAGPLQNGLVGYDMQKRYAFSISIKPSSL